MFGRFNGQPVQYRALLPHPRPTLHEKPANAIIITVNIIASLSPAMKTIIWNQEAVEFQYGI